MAIEAGIPFLSLSDATPQELGDGFWNLHSAAAAKQALDLLPNPARVSGGDGGVEKLHQSRALIDSGSDFQADGPVTHAVNRRLQAEPVRWQTGR
ncbi:hypothetical protein [Variovorax sp. PBL-E5]|uniref:hypothetical protein n=1 Tax=Variovorax sp. PBL-E5 TaxID=434014 RepID=UPI0013A59FF4|nr:hypothetical protein [Variovorax sp. PBL-E5]